MHGPLNISFFLRWLSFETGPALHILQPTADQCTVTSSGDSTYQFSLKAIGKAQSAPVSLKKQDNLQPIFTNLGQSKRKKHVNG